MNAVPLTLGALGLVLVAGCHNASSPAARTSTRPSATVTGSYGICPSPQPQPKGMGASVDYGEVVVANGLNYVGDNGQLGTTSAQRGVAQFKVRCTASIWSDTYGQVAQLRDHDATFLLPGTVVYAVKGQSPHCSLMARMPDGWRLFKPTVGGCSNGHPAGATGVP